MARTDREKQIIQRFLNTYNAERASSFQIVGWPDDVSTAKAVDALAEDPSVGVLAIEHTLIQPFEGEKADSAIFMRVIGELDQRADLQREGFDVNMSFQVGAFPKGVPWAPVAPAVADWYNSNIDALPVGTSQRVVAGLPFDLTVDIEKEESDGSPNFFIGRSLPEESLAKVVRCALHAKLPKLVDTPAARRVLLLEKNSLTGSPDKIGATVDLHRDQFPELERVDEIWVVNTGVWPYRDYSPSYFVWPRAAALAFRRLKRIAKRLGPEFAAAYIAFTKTGRRTKTKHHDSAIEASRTNRFNGGGPVRSSRECSRHRV